MEESGKYETFCVFKVFIWPASGLNSLVPRREVRRYVFPAKLNPEFSSYLRRGQSNLNDQRTLTTFIKTYRRVIKSSNLGYTISSIQGLYSIDCVRFARYCGKMYSRHLFFLRWHCFRSQIPHGLSTRALYYSSNLHSVSNAF